MLVNSLLGSALVYALLGLEILWQSRARVPLAAGPRSRVSRPRG